MVDDIEDPGGRRRRRMIVGLLWLSMGLLVTVLVMLWMRENCNSCDPVAATTTEVVTTTVATTTVPAPTTSVASTTTVVPPVAGGEYCVTDTGWNSALNVRSGPGTANPVIGTFPFYAAGILSTGESEPDEVNQVWFEVLYEGAFTGKAWVASWLLTAAPCGPVVDFDVTFTTGYAEIDFDPLEWAPDGSCDTDYCGTINGSITDRGTFPVDPDAEVILLDKELQALPPLSLSQFDFYLDGFGYDPVVHFYPPSYSFPDPATKADGGQPYQLTVENGMVTRIEQLYTP